MAQDIQSPRKPDTAKRYKCTMSQAGGAAPVVEVLLNEIGPIVWTRSLGAGNYVGTLVGAFPNAKKVLIKVGPFPGNSYATYVVASADAINLNSHDVADQAAKDDLLSDTTVEIEIFE